MKYLNKLLSVIIGLLVTVSMTFAGDANYVGVSKCKMCHMSPKRGAQYKKWEAGPHANAFKTLQTAEAKEVGKKLGVEDPATSDKCLKCHVTAHGVDAAKKEASFKVEEGVGCESCHGPGSIYKAMKVMKDLEAGKVEPASVDYKRGDEATCKTCHNEESPTYKPFDFKEKWAKIEHNYPAK